MAKAKPKPETVGNRIERARTNYGMSQAQLGVMLKVTRAAVSQYEQDKIAPRKRVILRLAEVFGAAPEWFEHGHGERPKAADLPVSIPEIDLDLITPEIVDLRILRTGRQWTMPSSMFDREITADQMMVAFAAPNPITPIKQGDRVVVDLQRRTCPTADAGVFLVYVTDERQKHRAQLKHYQGHPIAADILGRVVGFYRPI